MPRSATDDPPVPESETETQTETGTETEAEPGAGFTIQGQIIDTRRSGKAGIRFEPWMIFGGLVAATCTFGLFGYQSPAGFVVWIAIWVVILIAAAALNGSDS